MDSSPRAFSADRHASGLGALLKRYGPGLLPGLLVALAGGAFGYSLGSSFVTTLSLALALLIVLWWREHLQVRDSQAALRASEQRFLRLFDQAAVGINLTDTRTGRFERVNQRFCDIVGYPMHELLQLDFQHISHPDDLAQDLAQMQRLHAGEISEFRMEKRYFHKSGQEVWVDLSVSALWERDATPDYHVAVVQDITPRKHMEQVLRESESRLRLVLQCLPVGVCLMEADGRLSYRNEEFVRICGYTEQEVPTLAAWWECAYPDLAMRAHYQELWAELAHAAMLSDGVITPAEYLIHCKDGRQRPVEVTGVPLGERMLVSMLDLSERKAAAEEIHNLAFYDLLTRLPNRRLLRDRLQQTLVTTARYGALGALLLLDIDDFKTVNETQGHEKGDALLRQVAQRLREAVRADDTVARLGGDEFAVLLEDLGDTASEAAAFSSEVGEKILAALRKPFDLDGAMHHSSVSMGVTLFSGQDAAETVDELLKRADLAMYQAKAAGRDTLCFYEPAMQASVTARAALEADMRKALAEGQFVLYYQPQWERERIVGAEALLRWQHPRDGFVSPAQFIPLAEQSGLIVPLGTWVLQQACVQLARWAQEPALAQLAVAVNVSPRQFRQSDFVAQVLAALASHGTDPRRLKLELTEGLLLEDTEATIVKMSELKRYGVGFALDDFGTGYSSLAYLKRLPFDQLKIDQSFVRDVLTDPNDAAIARTIVALGASLGLSVMAEGVESEAQRAFLERHQCHSWQGYLLGRPMPVQDFEHTVRAQVQAQQGPERAADFSI